MKLAMVSALDKDGEQDPPLWRIGIEHRHIEHQMLQQCKKELSDFVSKHTQKFFVAVGISQEFLQHEPGTWDDIESYITAQKRILSLKVVNDAAESGVALIQSFNAALTNQE